MKFILLLFLFWAAVCDCGRRNVKRMRRKYEQLKLRLESIAAVDSHSVDVDVGPNPCPGLIVLGMHRSGTSLVTGLLSRMGLQTGGPLLRDKIGDNPRGYYERADVKCVNDGILIDQRLKFDHLAVNYDAWHGLQRLYQTYYSHTFSHIGLDNKPVGIKVKNKTAHYRWQSAYTALNFFSNASNVPWVMKDPRVCITYTTWITALTTVPFATPDHGPPAVLLTYRHPLDVAMSLNKRAKKGLFRAKDAGKYNAEFEVIKALVMWYVYNKLAIKQSSQAVSKFGVCRVVTSDAKILHNPYEEMNRLGEILRTQCHLKVPNSLTMVDVTAFHDPKLHQSSHVQWSAAYCQDLANLGVISNDSDISHSHFDAFRRTFVGDHNRHGILYKEVMRVYCAMERGAAFERSFLWNDAIVDDFKVLKESISKAF